MGAMVEAACRAKASEYRGNTINYRTALLCLAVESENLLSSGMCRECSLTEAPLISPSFKSKSTTETNFVRDGIASQICVRSICARKLLACDTEV